MFFAVALPDTLYPTQPRLLSSDATIRHAVEADKARKDSSEVFKTALFAPSLHQ